MNDMSFEVSFETSDDMDMSMRDEEDLSASFSSSIKGDPGFSPIASVIKEDGKAIITITDKKGTTRAEVFDGSTGTMDHGKLKNRDAADQHPKAAITGLEADLLARPDTAITDTEILNL